eukprot:TRINITY_DN38971_c0_g1_i1.p1 TRINITY_DN38971_c0_g1~~TRINITY_DN38971_c0_g1_i1.p1  ORF type:complete len:242 (+),score=54.86 TRINITY_DN38971_c0_g1_i1:54-728(+)
MAAAIGAGLFAGGYDDLAAAESDQDVESPGCFADTLDSLYDDLRIDGRALSMTAPHMDAAQQRRRRAHSCCKAPVSPQVVLPELRALLSFMREPTLQPDATPPPLLSGGPPSAAAPQELHAELPSAIEPFSGDASPAPKSLARLAMVCRHIPASPTGSMARVARHRGVGSLSPAGRQRLWRELGCTGPAAFGATAGLGAARARADIASDTATAATRCLEGSQVR